MTTFFSSPDPRLVIGIEDAVATVSIDNPSKFNALDFAMWRAWPALMDGLARDPRVRVIVIRGAGEASFASGADIAEFSTLRANAEGGRVYEAANDAAFHAIAQCPKPVLAMIRGFCLGGGFGLALCCDLRIASDTALFGIPAGRLGIGYPPASMKMITAAIGGPAAKDLLFTARRIKADEALRLGTIQRLTTDSELEATTRTLARVIAANAPMTLAAAKAAIDASLGVPHAGADPLALAEACFDSADAAEGRMAFLEKRAPVFRGV